MPSIRELAATEGVGVNTARSAFELLDRDGLAVPVERGGYFVARRSSISDSGRPAACYEAEGLDAAQKIEFILSRSGGSVGFALAEPDPDLLPIAKLERLHASLPPGWSGYGDKDGEPELRRRIASASALRHGRLEPESIVVTNGATEAISLALRSCVGRGDVVAVESPTYFDFFRQLSAIGAKILEVPAIPGRGMDLDLLEAAMRSQPVRMVVCQPNVQNPTGSVMPDADKQRLVALATRHGVLVLQDDVYGELAYRDPRPSNLDMFDDYRGLIYVTSFSKTLAPGLRVGWIRAPGLKDEIIKAKSLSTLATNRPAQAAIAAFIGGAEHRRHLSEMRAALETRLGEYSAALASVLPDGSSISRPAGGCLLWVSLPAGASAARLFEAAARERILVAPGELFSANPFFGTYLRINYAGRLTERRRAMISRLGELARSLAMGSQGPTGSTPSA